MKLIVLILGLIFVLMLINNQIDSNPIHITYDIMKNNQIQKI